MPRISPSLVRKAYSISPHAAALLPVCRDLPSALNELRWIRDHARAEPRGPALFEQRVAALCRERGRGVPLQYILGTQPFGDLEIKCRPGVLIPRPEPEAYTTQLAGLIKSGLLSDRARAQPDKLDILDFCTGTGCIPLLLYSMLQGSFEELHIVGVDISQRAVSLAKENIRYNVQAGSLEEQTPPSKTLTFSLADMFSSDWDDVSAHQRRWDVITCNPPYISRDGFARDTARSVRNFEPKLAQVPVPREGYEYCRPEDVFYARLLEIGAVARPRAMLCEVGDMDQARRVVELALGRHGGVYRDAAIEIWRDWPDMPPEIGESLSEEVRGVNVPVRGRGHGRAVFILRD